MKTPETAKFYFELIFPKFYLLIVKMICENTSTLCGLIIKKKIQLISLNNWSVLFLEDSARTEIGD